MVMDETKAIRPRRRPTPRGILCGVLLFIAIVAVLLVALCWYMIGASVSPGERGRDLEGARAEMIERYPELEPWLDSLEQASALRDTLITAEDGARLHAYYIEAHEPTQATAVIVHGYTDNAMRMMMIGYMYHHQLGYNILLPNLRYSGLSDGDHYGMGWRDRIDVLRWMQVADERFGGQTQMVVHGLSMGAATVMMLSGEQQEGYVRCFVEDCGYTSVWDIFEYNLRAIHHLPSFPLMDIANAISGLRYGWTPREASALKQVKRCTRPMLFIHGGSDTYVPTYMVYPLYEAHPGPKELWVPEGVEHAASYHDRPEEYTQRVAAFVGRYIDRQQK